MKAEELNLEHLESWTRRAPSIAREKIELSPVRTLAAILDREIAPAPGDALPPLWHWIFFTPILRASQVGSDGHNRRGGFLPPVPLKRRMWAGSHVEFKGALRIGQTVEKCSRVKDVTSKQGASGPLVFVTLEHRYSVEDVEQLVERQQLVYATGQQTIRKRTGAAPVQGDWSRVIQPDPVLLFRYSSITANSHRIHYDRDYATREEGYRGLVVHAPLSATLMLELLHEKTAGERLAQFRFRALQPLLDIDVFTIHGHRQGNEVTLYAVGPSGQVAVQAVATLDEISPDG